MAALKPPGAAILSESGREVKLEEMVAGPREGPREGGLTAPHGKITTGTR